MLLQEKETGALVEVLDVQVLTNPAEAEVPGQIQAGQEEQDAKSYGKDILIFPSGEDLPRCWVDADYRMK
ncbi:acetyltransferase [Myxacorys almedinensis]|uniref:Acetyltransferase n=1 Tax=Myxacorys almedinensis A TaxID=2690445 RepID=A0A8J7Z3I3_9CYAN|nr:acetyltransferase [Myxacorys almedinensis]NDJ19074.1 acetyltransferase [Myxacorys almedinensis A]